MLNSESYAARRALSVSWESAKIFDTFTGVNGSAVTNFG